MRMFGLVGHPLSHSFSKTYFENKFTREGISDCEYRNFDVPEINTLHDILETYPELEGINVTIPYKQEALHFADYLDESVLEIGAVNCLHRVGGDLAGYNTDVHGFRESLVPYLQPHHKQALILGAGGSAKAIMYVLKKLGILFQVVSRKPGKGINYTAIDEKCMKTHTLIINCTPVGMHPREDSCPPIPYELITDKHLLYDLIYNPPETLFLQKGFEQGATVVNGQKMLELQAEKSWEIWNS